jgi:hypothetical protein
VSENTNSTQILRIGLLTLDSVNEMYAGKFAAKSRDLVIAAPKLESLQKAEVHAIVYDHDHLKMFGDPVDLVIPGAARLQVAFGHTLTRGDARRLRRRGVIVCRRLQTAIRLVARLLRYRPAAAA